MIHDKIIAPPEMENVFALHLCYNDTVLKPVLEFVNDVARLSKNSLSYPPRKGGDIHISLKYLSTRRHLT